ncbi:General odorant-binding protein 1 [Orchesella cincta]|uniref:General odorant-binding protein 1 n=1 Tax=Orchesella cincta TaxID=48709 RepID=A0A1D2NIY6_ORCCI|nr:General odorant-binding protein 1 [Orchesella cincta]
MVFQKMDRSSVFVVLAIVLAVHTMMAHSLDEALKKECLKISKRTLKVMLKSFNACNDKLKLHHVSGEEYQKKVGCVVKCVMQTMNLLDDKEMITSDTLKASVEANIPAEFVPPAHEILMKCVNEQKLDPKDENCKSYLDMGTCMQGAVAEACGELPMM